MPPARLLQRTLENFQTLIVPSGPVRYNPQLSPFFDENGPRAHPINHKHRGVAQLVEHWFPKPAVAGSSPSAPAIIVACDGMDGALTVEAEATK